jgi:acyl phosphate:glycerol-3-phosphate acyltransferase
MTWLPAFESGLPTLLFVAVLAYLLGSIPFGLVITRALGLGDLRAIGSGNIGATNVLRTGNKGAALATLLLDAGKGGIAVLIARALTAEDGAQMAALMSFAGHLFPVWLGFRGGKGVATFLGTLLALTWPAGLLVCATWIAVAAVFRMSSLAALVAVAATPVWVGVIGYQQGVSLAVALAVLVWVMHRANLGRLLAGTEPKIGRK